MFRITTFSRGIHSPQQGLGIANICLENARKTKDPELALELCGDADEVIAQVTKAMKRSTTSLNHSDDQGIREELATAYVELGRLQDGLGQGDKARANIKNSESWGGHVRAPSQLSQHSGHNHAAGPTKSLPVPTIGTTTVNPPSSDVATISQHIFTQNTYPPMFPFNPPGTNGRFGDITQLTCCISLLQTSQSPNDVLDPVARDWLLATQNDTDERERLDKVATDVIIEFKRDEIKDVNAVAEVICLAPVLGKDEFRILLRQFYDGIDQSSMLNLPQLQGLAQVIQGASTGFLDSDDLVKILELLSERLRDTHRQSSHHIYELTLAVSHVLDAMADIRVKGLDREKLHEPLSGYLDGLKGSSDPYLVYQAAYAYQALQCVPDNETLWQATLRRTGKVIQGASGLVSAAKALDLNGFVEGLGNIQQGLAGVPKAFQLAKSAYGDVAALAKSGKNFMSCLKEGLSFERKQAWYSAIRGADVLIRNGQLAGFKKLVCEAPCRRDPAFQWGVCQRLGEIAASTMWDTDTRSGAVAFLGEIYQNDAVWGQQTNIKQWILNILMQLASSASGIQSTAEDLFEALETDGDVKKRALYHGCREDGATLYPLKVESPALTVSPLLDRVQNKPDVEGTIRQLRKQRMNERGDAVYISPQGKASLQAADDARFPLMEKVNEFLAGNRKVFLLLGDSGAGKSTFNRALEYELWHAYNKKDGEIPLYISLPSIDKPEHDMIPKQLRRFNFTDAEITELKFHRNFLLICDGYDESQLTQNLYMSNRLNQTGEWNARMVISCRSEYIGTDYRDRFQPGDRNRQSDPTQLQEAVITPFSIDQIQDYIAQYVSVHQPLWRTEDYQETLRRIPSLMELVKNPFLLTLSLEVLPRMVDPGQRISATQVTRVTLYDQFIEQWLERGKRRLGEKELSPQAKSAFESLTDEGFTLNGIDFLKKLSVAIYKEQGGQPVVEYSRFKDEGSWKSTFFSRDDEKMLLREACPLTRSGNQYRFIHRSLLEYGLSRSVFDPLDYKTVSKPTITPSSRRGSTSSVWSFEIEGGLEETISAAVAKQPSLDPASPLAWRSFVNEPSLLQFLSERVKQEPIFKQQLFNFIEQSKDTKGWRTAAANAMTILVRAGVQLNAADLQGIQIPGADLSYGVFDSAQLQGADLRKVTLRGACLRQADLSGARMRSVEFGELPYLEEDGEVYSCVYSPDGRWFVVGVRSGNVSVYTTSTWEQQWILLGHKEGVECVGCSPRGDQIASGSRDDTARLWDVETGTCRHVLAGHDHDITNLAYSPLGDVIATASSDKTVRLWNVETGDCHKVLSGHSWVVYKVAFSRKGNQFASCSKDSTVRLWDVETGECFRTMSGHSEQVTQVVFSPQEDLIVSAGDDKTVRLWEAGTGTCRQTLAGHTKKVLCLAFSHHGAQVASGSEDKTIRLWDVETGVCRHVLTGHGDWVSTIAYSLQDDLIVSGCYLDDRTVRLWDVETGLCQQIFTGHSRTVTCVTFSPKGNQIASSSLDKTVRLWGVEAGASEYTSSYHSDRVLGIICSPKGGEIASYSLGEIMLWDPETGVCRCILKGHSLRINKVVYGPHGDRIASCSQDSTLRLWDVEAGTCIQTFTGHEHNVVSVAFSPQGHQIASASYDKTLRLWDVDTGDCRLILTGHTGRVLDVIYSPNGSQIASISMDNTIRLWDVETGGCRHSLAGHTDEVNSIIYFPEGDVIASTGSDKTIRLWDVETGACRSILSGHTGKVMGILFCPKTLQVASSSHDETVRLWNAGTGACHHTLTGHRDWVNGIAFSPQGDMVASTSNDNTVRLWDVSSGQCQVMIRDFHDNTLVVTWIAASNATYLAVGCFSGSVRMWQVEREGETCNIRLRWRTTNGELAITDALVRDVDGLSTTNGKILRQHGAVEDPSLRLCEQSLPTDDFELEDDWD